MHRWALLKLASSAAQHAMRAGDHQIGQPELASAERLRNMAPGFASGLAVASVERLSGRRRDNRLLALVILAKALRM